MPGEWPQVPEGRRDSDEGTTAVLVDWGLARSVEAQHTFLQQGTPIYASPEQLTGYNADQAWGRARLDPAADVWALGVTLHEMLTGRVPFSGTTHEELVSNALALNYSLSELEVRRRRGRAPPRPPNTPLPPPLAPPVTGSQGLVSEAGSVLADHVAPAHAARQCSLPAAWLPRISSSRPRTHFAAPLPPSLPSLPPGQPPTVPAPCYPPLRRPPPTACPRILRCAAEFERSSDR